MNELASICPRGRPREFCVDGALAAALRVFWTKGYEGTSLTDLTEAMGVTRPSLYAAFGNKEALFRKALDLYEREKLAYVGEALKAPTSRGVAERLLRAPGQDLGARPGRHPVGGLRHTRGHGGGQREVRRRHGLLRRVSAELHLNDPQTLYRHWEDSQWSPFAVDLASDREQWRGLADEQRSLI